MGVPGMEFQVETVGFEPTAVCGKAAIGPDFFVVGYIPRTAQVVVERWTITNLLLGTAQSQGGGLPKSILAKGLRKDTIVTTSALQPIKTAVFHLPAIACGW